MRAMLTVNGTWIGEYRIYTIIPFITECQVYLYFGCWSKCVIFMFWHLIVIRAEWVPKWIAVYIQYFHQIESKEHHFGCLFWKTVVDIKAIHFIIVLMLMPDSLSFRNAYIFVICWVNIHSPERYHEYLWLRPNENKLREFKFYGSLFNAQHLHLTQIANDDYNHCTIISNSHEQRAP